MRAKARKQSAAKSGGEWVRQSEAVVRLGVKRSTLVGRMARGDYKTRKLGGVVFVWVESAKHAA